jgi:AcrR family transcriptional regulator
VITDPVRRPGRPRSEAADRAILDAALEVFAECGFDGLTVEGVAARAGVAKATIYRRYPCKVDLVMAAASCLREAVAPDPDTGRVADDLRVIARALIQVLTSTPVGPAARQMVAEIGRNPDLRRAHQTFIAARRAVVVAAVRRGIEHGELRAGIDPELVADLVGGPIFYRYLVSGAPLDPTFADRVVSATVDAFRA